MKIAEKLILNMMWQKEREEKEEFVVFQELYKKAIDLIPKEKKRYWMKRVASCRTIDGKINLLTEIVDYWGKKGEENETIKEMGG